MERIVSVPHSGTRSLRKLLGLDIHFHFKNEKCLRHYEMVHIPVRNPWYVAESWACRRGKEADDMVNSYEWMFRFLEGGCPRKLYRMEDIEISEGRGERDLPPERIQEFQEIMRDRVLLPHKDFFSQFYTDQHLR